MLFLMEEFLFCDWPTLVWNHLFPKLAGSNYKNYWSHADQVKRKVNCGKFSLQANSVRIAAHKDRPALSMAKSTWKSEFHPYAVFSTRAQRSVMPSENFSLSSINKDHLKELQNYLNQKMIAVIDTVNDSPLGDNRITSHRMHSALVPAEAVENDQGHITSWSCSNKVGSITPLF